LATAGLALVAGAPVARAAVLGLAMLCLQASIGALNDLRDLDRDRGRKPAKPLPRGLVSVPAARLIAGTGLAAGLLLSLAGGPPAVAVALAGAATGYAYDLGLKTTAWSWLPFAAGVPLLVLFAWLGAGAALPGAFLLLVPLALAGGAALALSNELADDERDRGTGLRTAVGALGRRRAWQADLVLQATVIVVALGSLIVGGAAIESIGVADGSAALTMIEVALSRGHRPTTRERGWELQAIGLAGLGLAWLAGLAGRGLL